MKDDDDNPKEANDDSTMPMTTIKPKKATKRVRKKKSKDNRRQPEKGNDDSTMTTTTTKAKEATIRI